MPTAKETYDWMSSAEQMYLWVISILRFLIILTLGISLGSLYPLLGLLVFFVGYFMMPTSYTEYRPDEKAEGFMRFILGAYIALALFNTFQFQAITYENMIGLTVILPLLSPIFSLFSVSMIPITVFSIVFAAVIFAMMFIPNSSIRQILTIVATIIFILIVTGAGFITEAVVGAGRGLTTIYFMAFAFFAVTPALRQIERAGELKQIAGFARAGIGNMIFATFMSIAFADLVTWSVGFQGGEFLAGPGLMITIIWAASFFIGLTGGREQRPYLGLITLGMVMLLFTYSFTGTVGVALFGGFWAPVSQGVGAVLVPVQAAFDAAGNQMYCTQLFVTCPACYASDWRCQGGTPPTEAQGAIRAIELTNFQAINYLEGVSELNPLIPLIGTIEIENRGDFIAKNIFVEMDTLKLKDPEDLSLQQDITLQGGEDWTADKCYFTSCTAADSITERRCEWTSADGVVPGELKLLSFRCGDPDQNYEHWSFYNDCVCVDPESGDVRNIDCDQSCTEDESKTYEIISDIQKYMTIPVKYSYDYATNVTLEIDVMNVSVFEEKLLSREINIREIESKYSGGPVALGLWTQKQPLRDGEVSFGRVFISNNGEGEVTGKVGDDIIIKIPQTGGLKISGITFINNVGIKCIDAGSSEIEQTIKCDLTETLKSTADKDYKDLFAFFQFSYEIEDATIQEKSSLWRASFDYTYSVTDEITDMPISGTVY